MDLIRCWVQGDLDEIEFMARLMVLLAPDEIPTARLILSMGTAHRGPRGVRFEAWLADVALGARVDLGASPVPISPATRTAIGEWLRTGGK